MYEVTKTKGIFVDSDRPTPFFCQLDQLSRLKSTQTIDSTLTKSDRLDRLTRLVQHGICNLPGLTREGSPTNHFLDVA